MSIYWNEGMGYDGDQVYVRLAANQWDSPENVLADLDQQYADARARAAAKLDEWRKAVA